MHGLALALDGLRNGLEGDASLIGGASWLTERLALICEF